jgi:hypothetical protein
VKQRNYLGVEKVFANTPTNNKGNKVFYTLFALYLGVVFSSFETEAWVQKYFSTSPLHDQ